MYTTCGRTEFTDVAYGIHVSAFESYSCQIAVTGGTVFLHTPLLAIIMHNKALLFSSNLNHTYSIDIVGSAYSYTVELAGKLGSSKGYNAPSTTIIMHDEGALTAIRGFGGTHRPYVVFGRSRYCIQTTLPA